MQIEFNTSRITKGDVGQPAARPDAAPPSTDTTSFTSTASLEAQLNAVPAARPDAVATAKRLLSDPNYPPLQLLDRIANLLAVHNPK